MEALVRPAVPCAYVLRDAIERWEARRTEKEHVPLRRQRVPYALEPFPYVSFHVHVVLQDQRDVPVRALAAMTLCNRTQDRDMGMPAGDLRVRQQLVRRQRTVVRRTADEVSTCAGQRFSLWELASLVSALAWLLVCAVA